MAATLAGMVTMVRPDINEAGTTTPSERVVVPLPLAEETVAWIGNLKEYRIGDFNGSHVEVTWGT